MMNSSIYKNICKFPLHSDSYSWLGRRSEPHLSLSLRLPDLEASTQWESCLSHSPFVCTFWGHSLTQYLFPCNKHFGLSAACGIPQWKTLPCPLARNLSCGFLSSGSPVVNTRGVHAIFQVYFVFSKAMILICLSSKISQLLYTFLATVNSFWMLFSACLSIFCILCLMPGAAWLTKAMTIPDLFRIHRWIWPKCLNNLFWEGWQKLCVFLLYTTDFDQNGWPMIGYKKISH